MASWEDLATPVGAQPSGSWEDLAVPLGGSVPSPQRTQDIGDAIINGLQNSATGLALRGRLPEQQLDPNAPWYQRLASEGASVLADVPLSIGGAAVGATAGTAVAPGLGTAIGGGAGAFAAPMALREALMDAYTHNYATSWAGVWEIAKSAMLGGTKGALIGGATFGAGRFAKPLGGVAQYGAELSALTATSAAVEQHMPTWQDFMDNAILLGGAKLAVHVAGGLRDVYVQTGKTPTEVVADARSDPSIAEALKQGVAPEAYVPLALNERIKAAVSADPRPEQIRAALGTPEPPKLGAIDLTKDPVKYEYITDQDTLKGVLRATESLYQDEISQQTRGTITNTETAAQAIKAVSDGAIAEHAIATAENAAQIYGRAHILKGVTENAFEKISALKDIPEADLTPRMKLQALAAIEQVSMVLAEFRGARAEAGRALQIFNKIKSDSSVLGDAEQIVKLYEKKGKLQDVAQLVDALKDPAQMQRFVDGYSKATTMEQVLEAWKAGMVSGPWTHMANIMGNLGKWVIDVPENALSATLTAAQRGMQGDPLTWAQYKARAFAPLYGLQFGGADSLKIAAEVWKGQGEHIEKGDIYRTAIPGKVGQIIRLPFRALQVEDAIFRTPAERAEAHIMAVDRAVTEGLHPETLEFREAIQKYTEHPDFGLEGQAAVDAVNRVQQAGAEGVFSQRLGPRMETVQRALAGSPMQFIVPFFRTPVNLLSWAVQHTPGLNLMSGRWRADFAAGGEARAKAVARLITGSAIALTAYSLANQGLITGGGLFDKEQGNTKRAAGWQPYSFVVDGKYYSYQRMEPVAKVIGIAADLIEMMQATKDPQDLQKMALMLTLVFGNATVSTTYMSGLSNTINGVTDPKRYLPTLMEQYATSVVPKIVGQGAQFADPTRRDVDGAIQAIQSQLPYFREKLLPKRDVWGEPTTSGKWFAIMPVAVTEASTDKVKTEAMRLQLAIADAPKYINERGPFNPKDKAIELTQEQRDVFRAVSGKFAMTILAPIVNAPDWNRIPDFAKAEIYKKVISGAHKQGAYAALPPEDAARVLMREKIVNEIIRQTQGVETPAAPAPERRVR